MDVHQKGVCQLSNQRRELGENKDTNTKSTKRNIANTYAILPSTGLNQELNAGQHMTIADCLVDYSKLKKTKKD